MADDLQLRKRALELELELAQAQQAHGQMTHQGAPMDPEALTKLRGAVSAALTGPSSAVAGLADLATQGLTNRAQDAINYGRRVVNVGSRLIGGNVAQGDVQLSEPYKFSPPVQQLEDTLAGSSRQPGEYLRPAMSAATGSLLFPGGPATNLASGGAASVADTGLANSGAGPKSRLAGSVLAAYLAAKGVQGAGRFAANRLDTPLGGSGRIAYAVEQTDPGALAEAAKEQERMASRGYQIFPGQGTQYETPALDRLQAEVVQSHGGGAAARALRQRATQQQHDAARIVKETVDNLPGYAGPREQVAASLAEAAQQRLGADKQSINRTTESLYEQGKANKAPIPIDDVVAAGNSLKEAFKAAPAGSDAQAAIAQLHQRLKRVVQASGGQVTPNDLRQLHQDFRASLDNPAPGATFVPNANKGDLRELSEKALLGLAERYQPSFQQARELGAQLREGPSVRMDPLSQMAAGSSPEGVLGTVLSNPSGLRQVAKGVTAPVWDPQTMRSLGTEVLGAAPEVAQAGLKTAFEQARQKAYSLGTGGKVSPQAALFFRNQVAGLPDQQQALASTLKSLGADAPGVMTNLDDITSLSRPALPTHAYPAGTDINAFQMTKAVAGGPFAREASTTNIIKSLVNRMSNRSVAKVLARPDSVAEMQRIAGAQALEPRKLLSLILAAQAQAQQNQAQPVPQE